MAMDTAAGMFFGHGYDALGFNALFVFATNLVCINVSGSRCS